MQTHIGGIVGMDAFAHADLQRTQRVSRAHLPPCSSCAPTIFLAGAVLERAVLHELGIKPAVGAGADVLEEDAKQFVTNQFATLGRLHGLGGLRRQVENGKTVMAEDDFGLPGDDERVLRVRPAMLHVLHHGLDAFQMAVVVLLMEDA